MIPDSEIPKRPEFEVRSKIGKIFKKRNSLEECSVRLDEIDPYFYEHYENKIQVDKNGCKYILFSSINWWKRTYWQRHYFWKKRQKGLEKKLGCKFIRIDTSNAKNGCDLYYEIGNVQAFIDEFKNKKIKKLEKKNNKRKRNEREIRKRTKRQK